MCDKTRSPRHITELLIAWSDGKREAGDDLKREWTVAKAWLRAELSK